MSSSGSRLWTCSRCLRAQNLRGTSVEPKARPVRRSRHPFCTTAVSRADATTDTKQDVPHQSKDGIQAEEEQGAMSRRLAEMAEETIDTGSKTDRKLMHDAGFSEDLKQQLEERIAQTSFAAQNQRAASQVNMPSSAGKGTRDIAGADPWTGSESLHDSALRMLDDSHKRLRTPFRPPRPQPVNLRPAPKKNISAADRLANARDKTSIYAFSQQNDMSEQEREKLRKEMKDRFSPGARPMPTTITGLTSLANERIEDAIARGQFRNLPRGKGINVERDYNANSPFLDTTEYFMNKIIQKQEIVPPWIEKQQELVKAVASFRGRLRNDWKRHAARMISSRGGSVQDQVRRARGYALAEERVNPRPLRRVENFSSIASDGTLTTVTVEEKVAAGVPVGELEAESQQNKADKPERHRDNHNQEPAGQSQEQEQLEIKITEQPAEDAPIATAAASAVTNRTPPSASSSPSPSPSSVLPMPHPFRDPTWQNTELAYHTLAIQELNALTRSYNLMAPKIAQKPYFTLQRELDRCFADVAPLLGDEILERSRRPAKIRVEVRSHKEGSVLGRFGEEWNGHQGRIRDEVAEKGYGFREFWRDLFGKERQKGRRNTV
ncbi:hypothetical protein A1O7_00282 [Cladophialophora yegresii CBS 114405]|uniref:DnaJ homologue subfamily C member 28 conserved domain-containing protein n=1 Tax=Cladophialophora yegresii CBS 114405 TaxID=1182544 RepID=W9W773_9EURO|nr:uncharacterized protein A1O7_00282 [Cladophialophora yegresii CBS 114405]EXJ63947.1 hypothetical protein A1O7_00282 [Cladophialophora yegresii CBS 114405]